MAGALAFVHPSTFESFGIVLLESFLAGTPALVHARSEVLRWQCRRSGGGLWFRHYPDFEEELLLLLNNENLRKRMGAAGKKLCAQGIFLGFRRKEAFRFAGCRLMKNAGGTSAEDSGHYTGGRDDLQCLRVRRPRRMFR